MISQPRPVKFRTILELLKKRPILFNLTWSFLIPTVVMSILFSSVFPQFEDNVPEVDYERIESTGEVTTGTINRIGVQYNITINGAHPAIVYYSYEANGTSFRSKFKTLSLENLQVGDKIEIKYLDGDSIITALEPFDMPVGLFFLAPAICMLVALSSGLFLYYLVRRELNLYKYGNVAEAEVLNLSHATPGVLSRSLARVKIGYRYQTGINRMHLGESVSTDMTLVNTLRRHDRIKIFVSPDDESSSTIVPLMESVRNNWNIE